MPTYENTTNRTKTLVGGISNRKRESIRKYTIEEVNFYPTTLPTGVNFISHEPIVHPFLELASVEEYPSSAVNCFGYATLIFYNNTDDVVLLYANGDDENILEIPKGVYLTVESDGKWGTVTFTEGGSGTVKLWGV